MLSKKSRKLIIRIARTWIGTHFHHQGRLKKQPGASGGCDCIGLIMGIANEIGINSKICDDCNQKIKLSNFDNIQYSKIPRKDRLLNAIDRVAHRICYKKSMPGDLLLFSINRIFEHIAIKSDHNMIIHCLNEVGMVIEQKIPRHFLIKAVFEFDSINSNPIDLAD